jgi:hypothetical protein
VFAIVHVDVDAGIVILSFYPSPLSHDAVGRWLASVSSDSAVVAVAHRDVLNVDSRTLDLSQAKDRLQDEELVVILNSEWQDLLIHTI